MIVRINPKMAKSRRNSLLSGVVMIGLSSVFLVACNASGGEEIEPVSAAPIEDDTVTLTETVSDAEAEPAELAGDVGASDMSDEGMRQAASHVHGVAELALALDGSTLSAEFTSPYYNIVGFEHAPETDEQRAAIRSAERVLNDAAGLIRVNSEAGCAADDMAPIVLMGGDGKNHDHSDDHDHDDHSHTHDDHDHSHDDGTAHNHKDAFLSYIFTCAQADRVEWIELPILDAFENLEAVDLVFLGPSQQMGATVTSSSNRIALTN